MKKELVLLTLAFFLLSCGNKSQETESVIYDDNPIVDPETPITREEYETYQGNE